MRCDVQGGTSIGEPCIALRNLSKRYRVHHREPGLVASLKAIFHRTYRDVAAVSDLTLDIAQGECVALVGENGAGKTTLMKMLAGILHPTSGEANVYGVQPFRRDHDFLRRIAFLSGQKAQLAWDLSPADSYDLFRAIYGIPRDRFRRNLEELTETLGLTGVIDVQCRRLSLGQRMKCELAGALLHQPSLLLLDEPTIGLDFDMQDTLRRFLRDYARRHGATVLITSHYMADVEAVADRLLLLQDGAFIFDGQLADFVARHATARTILATLVRPDDQRATVARIVAGLDRARAVWTGEHVVRLDLRNEDVPATVRELTGAVDLADLEVRQPSLETTIAHFRAARAEARS